MSIEKNTLAGMVVALESLSDDELYSANGSIEAWGQIDKRSRAFKPMLDIGAIRSDGSLEMDLWAEAVAHAVNTRL